MSNIIHMETEAVRNTAEGMLQFSNTIETAASTIRQSVSSMVWSGPSREEFESFIAAFCQQTQTQAENLRILSDQVRKEVEQWETAAAHFGGSVPAGGTVTPPTNITPAPSDNTNDPLFKKGDGDAQAIQHDDVKQRSYGDCYLMADLAAIAKTHPELIQQMVTVKEDGTYTVRFFDENGKPVFIDVKNGEPISEFWGFKIGSKSSDQGEEWPSVIEKAYAQWKGSNKNIEGGHAPIAFREITGKDTLQMAVTPINQDEEGPLFSQYSSPHLLENLRTAVQANDPIVISTTGNPGDGLVANHVYTVDKIVGDEVYLYNPWGTDHAVVNINELAGKFDVVNILPVSNQPYYSTIQTVLPEY